MCCTLVLFGLLASGAFGQSRPAIAPQRASDPDSACPQGEQACADDAITILLTYLGVEERADDVRSDLRRADHPSIWPEIPAALFHREVVVRERLLSPRELRQLGDYAICRLRADDGHGHFMFFAGNDGQDACFLDLKHFRRHELLRIPFSELGRSWDGLALLLDRKATAAALEPTPTSALEMLAVGGAGTALAWLFILRRRRNRVARPVRLNPP